MKRRPRIHYTEGHKALTWERWQKGESLQQIAQLFDRNHSSIQQILAATGGIRPAPRCRSRLAHSIGRHIPVDLLHLLLSATDCVLSAKTPDGLPNGCYEANCEVTMTVRL